MKTIISYIFDDEQSCMKDFDPKNPENWEKNIDRAFRKAAWFPMAVHVEHKGGVHVVMDREAGEAVSLANDERMCGETETPNATAMLPPSHGAACSLS